MTSADYVFSDNLASNKDLARTYAMNAATAIRIACS